MSETPLRAINSSSKLKQRLLCPGSAHAERAAGPSRENENAAEGTLLHWKDSHPEESRDELKPEQRVVLGINQNLRTAFLSQKLKELNIPPTAIRKEIVEQEFFLCSEDGMPLVSHGEHVPGHPDIIYYFPEHGVAFIFDSKFGRIEVPAAWINLQLRSYAVMLSDHYSCDHIFVAITQPWAKLDNNFHVAEYHISQIPEFRKELLDILAATEPADAPLRPSVEACTYCSALANGFCRVAIKRLPTTAKDKIEELSPEEMESLAPEMELAEKVIKAWKERMKELAAAGKLKNYQISKGRATAAITNNPKAFKSLFEAGLLSIGKENSLGFIFESDVDIEHVIGCLEKFLTEYCGASFAAIRDGLSVEKKITKVESENKVTAALGDILQKGKTDGSLEKKPISLHEEKK